MLKITKFLYVHIGIIPLFILAYFVGGIHTLMMAYAVVMVHELFHLFVALSLKVRVQSIIIMPFGMTLRLQNNLIKSPLKEAVIALAGPLANILMIAVGALLRETYIWAEESMFLYLYLNYINLFLNLIPALPLDGGRVLKAILTQYMGFISSYRIMEKITKIFTIAIFLIGVILIYITKFNISLVMVGAFLAFNMVEEKKHNDFIIMKEILYSKEKLPKRGVMPSKNLSAMEDVPASRIFKKLSYHSFHHIYIVNQNLGIRSIITEAELIDAVLHQGYAVKLGDIKTEQNK